MEKRGIQLIFSFLLLGGLILSQIILNPTRQVLVLSDQETGITYGQWVMDDGSLFSLSFIHSVNKSQVKDELLVKDGILYAHKAIYSGLGAGVQSELNLGETLTYDAENRMVVSNIKTTYTDLNLIVGTVNDHVLEIHGKEISLSKLCGKNTPVTFLVDQVRGAKDYER